LESTGIVEGQHEGQRCERTNPGHLLQQARVEMPFADDCLDLAFHFGDPGAEVGNSVERGRESSSKTLGERG
jgi:hypothetical protein